MAEATARVIIEKKMARTRKGQEPDREGERRREAKRRDQSDGHRRPGGAEVVERDGDAVAADAEKHGVGEGDDPGIPEQQVVARHEQDEDADLGGGADRLAARQDERGCQQPDQDRDQNQREHARARRVGRQDRTQEAAAAAARLRRVTGGRPGRS
jgi:hypothetical protein